MKCLMTMGLTFGLALGFAPESFRLQSSTGIWEDDYDLIFDPARILEITGTRIYTGLSGHAVGADQPFSGQSGSVLLIGASTRPSPGLGFAGLYDRRWQETPLPTGLFGANGDTLRGLGARDSVIWKDLDTNGSYDYKRVFRDRRSAWTWATSNDFFAGIAVKTGPVQLGLGVAIEDSSYRAVAPSSDYARHRHDSSLVAGSIDYLLDDSSHGMSGGQAANQGLLLSARLGVTNTLVLGLRFQPTLLNETQEFCAAAGRREDRAPGIPGLIDLTTEARADTSRAPAHGVRWPLTLQLMKTRANRSETWLTLTGFLEQRKLDPAAGDRTTAFGLDSTPLSITTWAETSTSAHQGKGSTVGLAVSILRRHSLDERLSLGWAARLDLNSSRDSTHDSLISRQVTTFDDGDSVPTHNDYVRTVVVGQTSFARTRNQDLRLTLPVGLEYRIIPALTLRLGARYALTWQDLARAYELIALEPRKERIEYGDGTFRESITSAEAIPHASEQQRTISQSMNFSYGLGCRPLKNLQLDLMGFANLTNLADWRLSVTFRF